MDVSVILPVINERDNLVALIPHLKTVLTRLGLTFEILVIDGGSRDGTREAAAELGARVEPERRRGYAGALETGFADALGDYFLTMDADLSHDPNFVPRMWRARTQGDIVIASRYVRGGASHGPIVRKEMSRLLNEVQRFALWMPVRDLSSGFRLYRRETAAGVNIEGSSFEVQQELLSKAYGRGFSIFEVPFTYFPRGSGKSHAPLFQLAIGYIRSTINLRNLRNRPDSADYEERAFYTLRPFRRLRRRDRHRIITTWAREADRTLHVGCGSGVVTQSLNNGIGMDRNFDKLRFLSRYGIAVVCASPDALPFRDASFDCLIGSTADSPLSAADAILSEMRRVLNPGGRLIFAGPDRIGASPFGGRAKAPSIGGQTFELPPRKELEGLLSRNGFAVEEHASVAQGEEIVRCQRVAVSNASPALP
ncbi:MAG TPA: glycosyltransferase [Candidatus Binataceae bacterium]|nr:glycosyltransferase [Candidatus Binataceae bacterium]